MYAQSAISLLDVIINDYCQIKEEEQSSEEIRNLKTLQMLLENAKHVLQTNDIDFPRFYAIHPKEVALVKEGKKVQAIKEYRLRTDTSLKEAKAVIDEEFNKWGISY